MFSLLFRISLSLIDSAAWLSTLFLCSQAWLLSLPPLTSFTLVSFTAQLINIIRLSFMSNLALYSVLWEQLHLNWNSPQVYCTFLEVRDISLSLSPPSGTTALLQEYVFLNTLTSHTHIPMDTCTTPAHNRSRALWRASLLIPFDKNSN